MTLEEAKTKAHELVDEWRWRNEIRTLEISSAAKWDLIESVAQALQAAQRSKAERGKEIGPQENDAIANDCKTDAS